MSHHGGALNKEEYKKFQIAFLFSSFEVRKKLSGLKKFIWIKLINLHFFLVI